MDGVADSQSGLAGKLSAVYDYDFAEGNFETNPPGTFSLTRVNGDGSLGVVRTAKTQNGFVSFSKVTSGNYLLQQIDSENGYNIDPNIYNVTVSHNSFVIEGNEAAQVYKKVLKTQADILSYVIDNISKQGIANVQVTLTNSINQRVDTMTDASGFFAFYDVKPGLYRLRYQNLDGYSENPEIVVDVDPRFNIRLDGELVTDNYFVVASRIIQSADGITYLYSNVYDQYNYPVGRMGFTLKNSATKTYYNEISTDDTGLLNINELFRDLSTGVVTIQPGDYTLETKDNYGLHIWPVKVLRDTPQYVLIDKRSTGNFVPLANTILRVMR
jgi:hypothetical protein